ncbi:MAG: hypothetical protein HKO64_06840 [Xanthomonadales bacterium]|nr:hypothetical protein [Xanthomonadales bacterium]
MNATKRILLTALLALSLAPGLVMAQQQEWNFRVFLDDREIGRHDFTLQEQGEAQQINSVADFEYKLLFVKLYEYQHSNTETWKNDCLESIDAKTNANGDRYRVEGEQVAQGFLLRAGSGRELLPACVMTFAYWNPDFLDSTQLLNSQNGELVEVSFSEPEQEELMVRGDLRTAFKYQLQAGDMNIRLWYSETNEWLALESDARGGRVLRYELM